MVDAPKPSAPHVATLPVVGVPVGSVTVSAAIEPNGAAITYWFEYGTKSAKLAPTAQRILLPALTESKVSASLPGLLPLTAYYFRVVARNTMGTTQGRILEFRTGGQKLRLPSATDSDSSQSTMSSGSAASPPAVRNNPSAGTSANQTATLEIVPGRYTPLVLNMAGTPTTASCAGLPEGTTCSYDDKTQTLTITPTANTPPGSYEVKIESR